jgi:hypothetical protein
MKMSLIFERATFVPTGPHGGVIGYVFIKILFHVKAWYYGGKKPSSKRGSPGAGACKLPAS